STTASFNSSWLRCFRSHDVGVPDANVSGPALAQSLAIPPSISPDDMNASTGTRAVRPRFGIDARWTAWIIGFAFVVMAARLAVFVNRYAVNLVYWDQWDFLQGLFDGADAWTLFRWQHGPQRQGIGNLITALLYSATGWNGRADAAASAIALLLAAAAGLWLVRRVCG